jgi:hypothetical protein
LQLIQELGAKVVPNKESKFWGAEIHRIVTDMELICGIKMLTNEWIVFPVGELESRRSSR